MLTGIGFNIAVAIGVLPLILLYAATSIFYTFRLKELPLVDVFTLAFLSSYASTRAVYRARGFDVAVGFSPFLFLAVSSH